MQLPARLCTVVILLTAGAVFVGTAPGALSDEPAPPPVTVANPVAQSVPRWDEYTGRFEPIQQVEVRPRVSGAIDSIHFVDGQLVKQGDLLFVVDPRPFQIAVDSAKASVARTKAQVAVAAYDVARARELVKTNVVGRSEVEHREAELNVATAEQLMAEAALRDAELDLEWTQVRAPISGRVSDHRVDVGNLVQGGQVGATLLTTIVELSPIHFVFDASEADYIRYARLSAADKQPSVASSDPVMGNPVLVRLADEADWNQGHSGSIDFLDNQLNSRGGTIRGRAVLENKDLFLVPGTFGRLRLFAGSVDALLVPDTSIMSDQTNKIVFVVNERSEIVQKTVTLGVMYRGLRVILDGLAKSDRVVIEGVANPFVRPGAKVRARQTTISQFSDTATN